MAAAVPARRPGTATPRRPDERGIEDGLDQLAWGVYLLVEPLMPLCGQDENAMDVRTEGTVRTGADVGFLVLPADLNLE